MLNEIMQMVVDLLPQLHGGQICVIFEWFDGCLFWVGKKVMVIEKKLIAIRSSFFFFISCERLPLLFRRALVFLLLLCLQDRSSLRDPKNKEIIQVPNPTSNPQTRSVRGAFWLGFLC